MNKPFLFTISFLIAFLAHMVAFNVLVIVFHIDPEPLKPKFFFLGSILSQNEFTKLPETSSHPPPDTAHRNRNSPAHFTVDAFGQRPSPFDVEIINKPLDNHAPGTQDKVTLKSSFETISTTPAEPDNTPQGQKDLELNIAPYRPLQIRTP